MDTFRVKVKNDISELHSKVERDSSAFYVKVDREMAESRAELRESRAELCEHRADLRNGLAQVSKILAELQASSSTHQSLLLSLCQQSREIAMPAAPTIGEHAVSTPSTSSVISNTSSTSSVPHIGTLTLDSPTIQPIPSLPGLGLLGPARDHSPSQCTSINVFIFRRDYRATTYTLTLVPGQIRDTSSAQSGAASTPLSRAPSRAPSTGGSRGESLSRT